MDIPLIDKNQLLKLKCPSCHAEMGDFPAPLDAHLQCPQCEYNIVWIGDCWDACIDKSYRRDFARQWVLWEAGKLGDPKLVYGADPKRFYNELLQQCNLTEEQLKTMQILEVGFGHGRTLHQVQQFCPTAYGLDLAKPLKSAELRPGSAIFGNLFNIPFMPQQFDLVVCRGVAHVTPDAHKAFDCLADQVKPDGRLFFAGLYEPGRGRLTLRKIFPYVWNYPESVRLGIASVCGVLRAGLECIRKRNLTPKNFIYQYDRFKIDIFDTIAPEWTVTLTENDVIPWFEAKGFQARKVDYGGYFGIKTGIMQESKPAVHLETQHPPVQFGDPSTALKSKTT
jgi:SAM-dependent methyltransferase